MNAFGANADREGIPALKTCCEKSSFKECIPNFVYIPKLVQRLKRIEEASDAFCSISLNRLPRGDVSVFCGVFQIFSFIVMLHFLLLCNKFDFRDTL